MRLPCLIRPAIVYRRLPRTASFCSSKRALDSAGIPSKPTWSVNQLLSSYPSPHLSSTTIDRLHELSALTPPRDQAQYQRLQKELEGLVKLVEAVRLVATSGVGITGRGELEDADRRSVANAAFEEYGQKLLKNAAHTKDCFYVVDSERRR